MLSGTNDEWSNIKNSDERTDFIGVKTKKPKVKLDIKTRQESGLLRAIKEDEKLTKDQKLDYTIIAGEYLKNFSDNINKTSIELNEEVADIGIDTWKEFLESPTIRKYIQGFKSEQINLKVDEGLMSGDKDVIGIKKAIQGDNQMNNSNIVIIRLPEKVDFNEIL